MGKPGGQLMNRFWIASLGLAASGWLATEALAGPPQAAAPSRTSQVRRQDDLAPRVPPAVKRGASAEPRGDDPIAPALSTVIQSSYTNDEPMLPPAASLTL